MANTIDGSLITSGTLAGVKLKDSAEILRTQMKQRAQVIFPIPLTSWRVWDNLSALLPDPSATDDLGIDDGTFGTTGPTIRTSDLKAAGVTTRYARALIALPHDYEDGETVTLRAHAGMITTVADNSATLDVECYVSDGDTTYDAAGDICNTAAQSINSLTFANIDFEITPTVLVAGSLLDIRLTVAVNDAASGTAVIAALGKTELLIDIRG